MTCKMHKKCGGGGPQLVPCSRARDESGAFDLEGKEDG